MTIIVPDPPGGFPPVNTTREIRINRKNTAIFIAANPINLSLIPRERVRTGSRGSKWENQTPREVQTCRIIPRDETTLPTFNDEGPDRSYDLVLLGLYTAAIAIRDYWIDDQGFRYEVMDVQRNAYEVKGAVTKKGNS